MGERVSYIDFLRREVNPRQLFYETSKEIERLNNEGKEIAYFDPNQITVKRTNQGITVDFGDNIREIVDNKDEAKARNIMKFIEFTAGYYMGMI